MLLEAVRQDLQQQRVVRVGSVHAPDIAPGDPQRELPVGRLADQQLVSLQVQGVAKRVDACDGVPVLLLPGGFWSGMDTC